MLDFVLIVIVLPALVGVLVGLLDERYGWEKRK